MPLIEVSGAVRALLPQVAQSPAAVIDQLRPLADAGDDGAVILLAWCFLQAGRWLDGIEYGRRAAKLGATQIAAQYASNLSGQAEHRDLTIELTAAALSNGWQMDPLGWLAQFNQRGDTDGAAEMLRLTTVTPAAARADEEWDELLRRARSSREAFNAEISEVESSRQEAIREIEGHEDAVEVERKRLEELGKKIETLAHDAAADELAKQYANQAKRNERTAFWFTFAAVAVGLVAAAVAVYFTLEHADDRDPDLAEGLVKAAVALPVALFAAYLGRLGSRYRHMAWRWRHVELQLRTAEPYIAELSPERRVALIEVLALRFFPGQGLDLEGVSVADDGPGLSALARPQP
jgi:hypothetical protein